jgi:hypothetical protein
LGGNGVEEQIWRPASAAFGQRLDEATYAGFPLQRPEPPGETLSAGVVAKLFTWLLPLPFPFPFPLFPLPVPVSLGPNTPVVGAVLVVVDDELLHERVTVAPGAD